MGATDKSKVKAAEVIDSSPFEVGALKLMIGVVSLSIIVKVWELSLPRVALTGLDKVIITVSSGSSTGSSIILAMVIVPLVSPALIVSFPAPRVKSSPDPVAVPVIA